MKYTRLFLAGETREWQQNELRKVKFVIYGCWAHSINFVPKANIPLQYHWFPWQPTSLNSQDLIFFTKHRLRNQVRLTYNVHMRSTWEPVTTRHKHQVQDFRGDVKGFQVAYFQLAEATNLFWSIALAVIIITWNRINVNMRAWIIMEFVNFFPSGIQNCYTVGSFFLTINLF